MRRRGGLLRSLLDPLLYAADDVVEAYRDVDQDAFADAREGARGHQSPTASQIDLYERICKVRSHLMLASLLDTVAERLRRWTANPLGSPSVGSNPIGVDYTFDSADIEDLSLAKFLLPFIVHPVPLIGRSGFCFTLDTVTGGIGPVPVSVSGIRDLVVRRIAFWKL
jgi:hypothetical protein